MISSLRLPAQYRDYWSEYYSMAAAECDKILAAGCYAPRYYHAPRNADELIQGPGGYLKYSLVIPAGSWILGFYRAATGSVGFLFNLTDVGLNHKFFSTPVPDTFFDSLKTGLGAQIGPLPPSLFCKPYPVVDPGSFLVEFWQNNNANLRCQMTFLVAEVDPLLVKS